MEWGNRWLVTFNATKSKLLSFNRDPLLVTVKMKGIKLPEVHIYSPLPMLLQGKWAPFIGPSISLLLNPSCICTNLPFAMYGVLFPYAPRSHGLDMLDKVQ